jgi:hypothetical protein
MHDRLRPTRPAFPAFSATVDKNTRVLAVMLQWLLH